LANNIRDERVISNLTHDALLLFLTRFTRLFAYGALSVVLVFYLTGLGLSESQTGLLFTLTLGGDIVVSLYLTMVADRIGRRRVLVVGSLLMAGAGLAFACTSSFMFLVIAGTIGVVSPSGNEVGPFLPIEQAALAHVVHNRFRTAAFGWYTLAGSVATANDVFRIREPPGTRAELKVHQHSQAAAVLFKNSGKGFLVAIPRLFEKVECGRRR
jgi:MFS family permease